MKFFSEKFVSIKGKLLTGPNQSGHVWQKHYQCNYRSLQLGQAGVAMGVALRTKNKKIKETALSAAVTGILLPAVSLVQAMPLLWPVVR